MSRSHSAGFTSSVVGVLLILMAVSTAGAGDLEAYYGFEAIEILKLDWELGPPLAGDVNGDGLNDLVVCNNRKARIELLLQKPDFDPNAAAAAVVPDEEDINDLFGREVAWRFKRFQYPLHVKATSVVLSDLNNDGRLDLAYYSDEGLHVAMQAESAAAESGAVSDVSWLPETRFDLRDALKTTEALLAADINNDKRTDLVLLLKDGYFVLLQTPEGRMGRPARHYSSSPNLKQVEIGDVNGDGRNDLVLLTADRETYPLRIRFQDENGRLGTESRHQIPATSSIRVCRLGQASKCGIVSVSSQSGRLAIYAMTQNDKSEEAVAIYPLPSDDEADKRDMTCGDVNGDGLTDMVITDPGRGQFVMLPGQAGTGLGPVSVFPGLKDMRKICAARLDDAAADTLVVLSVDEKLIALSGFENGRLSFPQTVAVLGEPQAMAVADLDGDDAMDLAYVAKGSEKQGEKFFLRTIVGLGRENARPGPSVELTAVEERPLDLLACDIDHDGDEDLIVVRSYDPLLLVRQTSPGVFEQQAKDQTHIGLVSNLSPKAISIAPLGPDGRPALLVARGDFARSLYFDAEKGWQVIDQYQAGDQRRQFRVAAAVSGADGAAPRIVAYDDVSGIVSFVDPQPDGTYRVGSETDIGTAAVRKIVTGCFGAGSSPEIVLCAERKLLCIRQAGAGGLRKVVGFEPEDEREDFGHFTIRDINSDGVPDIVLCERNRHHVQVLAFDENAQLVNAYKFKVFETHAQEDAQSRRRVRGAEPRYALVEDVTGDGKNDLVLLVHDRIILYPQN